MKRIVLAAVAAVAVAGTAQVLTPATGVANDHGLQKRNVAVAYAPRTAETGYGYVDGMTVIGCTFLPWAIPNSSWDVTGLRLNFGWGAYRNVDALDLGAFSSSLTTDGLQINLLGNYCAEAGRGWQNGLVNVAGRYTGLQIGLINVVDRLDGVQIGLLNFARTQWFFPFINVGW